MPFLAHNCYLQL